MTATTTPASTAPTADREVRLNLGGSTTPNRFDGTWQPRTRNLVEELPSLIAALVERGVPVARVSYHRDSWEAAPRRVMIGGRLIRLGGFRSIDPHQLSTVDLDHNHRTDLEVLPPDGSASVPVQRSGGLQRWETDGGPVGSATASS